MLKLSCIVDNRLRLELEEARSILGDDGVRFLVKGFEHENPTWKKLRAMGYFCKEPRILKTWSSEGTVLTLPRGGTSRLRAAAERVGAKIVWLDHRSEGRTMLRGEIRDHRVQLWPHQQVAVDKLIAKENCLLRAPTGAGKTTVALAMIAKLKIPSIVIVWTEGLLKQWTERCVSELGVDVSDLGLIQGSYRRLRPITLAMLQTLASRGVDRELKDYFGLMLLDEVQRSPSATTQLVVDAFSARYRIGVSATIQRKDRKEFITYDLFGDIAADIPSKPLEETGVVLPVEVRAVPTNFRAPWWTASASFEIEDIRSGEPGRDYGRLLDEMANDKERNAVIRWLVRLELSEGAQLLIFTQRVAHAQQLDQWFSASGFVSGLLIGGAEYRKVFDETVEGIKSRRVRIGVGTVQAIGVGQDFPSVEAGILALPIGINPYLFQQVRGRICRSSKGKRHARLYVLIDQSVFGSSMLRSLHRWNDGNVVVLDRSRGWIGVSDYLRGQRAVS